MRFGKRKRRGVSLDITPLVDTVFNLMIFFALSLNFIVTPGIKVNLPASSSEEVSSTPNQVTVTVTHLKEIYVDTTPVSIKSIGSHLKKASPHSDTIIILRADAAVEHGFVVEILDEIKKAGFKRVAISTRIKDKR